MTATTDQPAKVDAKTFDFQGERKAIAPAKGYALLARYQEAAAALTVAKRNAKAIEQEIMQLMGGFEHGAIDGQDFFHWPWVDVTTFDSKQLKEDEPALHAKYTETKKDGGRRFRVEGTVGVD